MRLWTFLSSLGAGAALCALALTAHGAVQNTPHNMNATFGANTIQDNQVCLPCHAPHNQPDPTQGFLWNHVMSANGSTGYTMYAPLNTSIEGKSLVVGLDDTSMKCLSCHDGSVAVDNYGGYNFTTQTFGSSVSPNKTFLGVANDTLGHSTAPFVIGGSGSLASDHPVGVLYPGLASGGTSWTSASSFNDPTQLASHPGQYYGWTTSNTQVWTNYVTSTGTTISRAAGGGMTFGTTGANVGNVVGCGSCHTPHTYTYNFLIVPNTNSQLCLTCHAK